MPGQAFEVRVSSGTLAASSGAGWQIDDGIVYPNSDLPVTIMLTANSHSLRMLDDAGVGWNEAEWTLKAADGVIVAGPFSLLSGFSSTQTFTVSADNRAATTRLMGGATSGSGRVEIYHNGEWGTVCDDMFGMEDADVVCRQLGYANGAYGFEHSFGGGSGNIWLDDVVCSGSEDSIEECMHNNWGDHNCVHEEDVGVMCETTCESFNWYQYDRSLGAPGLQEQEVSALGLMVTEGNFTLQGAIDHAMSDVNIIFMTQYSLGTNDTVRFYSTSMANFESATEQATWYAEPGAKSFFKNRAHESWLPITSVSSAMVLARDGCTDTVRLVGNDNSTGRVEVFYNGQWGTICDDGFDMTAANVVCRQLGFTRALAFGTNGNEGSGKIWIDDLECQGSEDTIGQCPSSRWGEHNCAHQEDVHVTCDTTSFGGWQILSGNQYCFAIDDDEGNFCISNTLAGHSRPQYGNNELCVFRFTGSTQLTRIGWTLENEINCAYDFLQVNSTKYCGNTASSRSFPSTMVLSGETVFQFRSDSSIIYDGFKLCVVMAATPSPTLAPTRVPTAAPTTDAPTPAPTLHPTMVPCDDPTVNICDSLTTRTVEASADGRFCACECLEGYVFLDATQCVATLSPTVPPTPSPTFVAEAMNETIVATLVIYNSGSQRQYLMPYHHATLSFVNSFGEYLRFKHPAIAASFLAGTYTSGAAMLRGGDGWGPDDEGLYLAPDGACAHSAGQTPFSSNFATWRLGELVREEEPIAVEQVRYQISVQKGNSPTVADDAEDGEWVTAGQLIERSNSPASTNEAAHGASNFTNAVLTVADSTPSARSIPTVLDIALPCEYTQIRGGCALSPASKRTLA
jgi:hypothetical protein